MLFNQTVDRSLTPLIFDYAHAEFFPYRSFTLGDCKNNSTLVHLLYGHMGLSDKPYGFGISLHKTC